jgi:hypothetical protein
MKPLTKQVVQKINLHNRTKTTKVKVGFGEEKVVNANQLLDVLTKDFRVIYLRNEVLDEYVSLDKVDFKLLIEYKFNNKKGSKVKFTIYEWLGARPTLYIESIN